MEDQQDNLQIEPSLASTALPAVGGVSAKLKFLSDIMIGIVLVLFIGFAGMFVATGALMIDAFKEKQSSYDSINTKLDELVLSFKKKSRARKKIESSN